MTRGDVQILSQSDRDGVRIYQLSPQPDKHWWNAFDAVVRGSKPKATVEIGYESDELRISGISEDNSAATDQWLASVVNSVNRDDRAQPH